MEEAQPEGIHIWLGRGNPFTGVSCIAPQSCVAVGAASITGQDVEDIDLVDRPFADSLWQCLDRR